MKISPLLQHVELQAHFDVTSDQVVVTSPVHDRPDARSAREKLYDVLPATVACQLGGGVTVGSLFILGFDVTSAGSQISVNTNATLCKNFPRWGSPASENVQALEIASMLDGGKVWWGPGPQDYTNFGLDFPTLTRPFASPPGTVFDIRLEIWIRDLELHAHTYTMMATRRGIMLVGTDGDSGGSDGGSSGGGVGGVG